MKTYIFGHKRPDTDSVCSAISYAYLKKQLNMDAEAKVLGTLNLETKFILKYFDIPEPKYLNDVKIQIRNMKYLKNAYINSESSLDKALEKINELSVTGLPMVDNNRKLNGYVNLKDICNYLVDQNTMELFTSYDNIQESLKGNSVLKFDNVIKGRIIIATYHSKTFMDSVELTKDDILIVGDRSSILEYAIKSKVKMIVIENDFKLPAELFVLANQNKINIISTSFSTSEIAMKIRLSNYIMLACTQNDPIFFKLVDYRDEFIKIAEKSGHTNYPVVDMKNNCVGMIKLVDQNIFDKCNVILVDHNQENQSVEGINEANILEVIDHHNIGVFQSTLPISFRCMPVGCTATIIYQIYLENHVEIPQNIAGIMLSAILSDTLLFKSPTTTDIDINTANELAKIAKVDIEQYGMSMFKAGTSIDNMSTQDIFDQDFKSYKLDNYNIGISQVMTLNIDSIIAKKQEYISLLNNMSNLDYKISLMFVTDIIKDGSYVFYNESAKELLSSIFQLKELKQGLFLEKIVSRKQQILPKILDYLQK